MHNTKALIRFNTHHAVIQTDERGIIHIFKYCDRYCDFDIFEEDESLLASDYILTPPNDMFYYVSIPGEIPGHLL